jgi:hypothetical protein
MDGALRSSASASAQGNASGGAYYAGAFADAESWLRGITERRSADPRHETQDSTYVDRAVRLSTRLKDKVDHNG